jgi:hypothetical protein
MSMHLLQDAPSDSFEKGTGLMGGEEMLKSYIWV